MKAYTQGKKHRALIDLACLFGLNRWNKTHQMADSSVKLSLSNASISIRFSKNKNCLQEKANMQLHLNDKFQDMLQIIITSHPQYNYVEFQNRKRKELVRDTYHRFE